MITLLPLVSLITFSQKLMPPKPKPAPAQKPVTPTARPATRPAEPTQPNTHIIKTDSSALPLLASGAESHKRMTMLESTLDWRYLSKANLSFHPTSTSGQKALDAALRSAQGTLTLTKDGQARLEVTTPGKDALPRATTLTDTKKLYTFRYDNDGKLAATTERAHVLAYGLPASQTTGNASLPFRARAAPARTPLPADAPRRLPGAQYLPPPAPPRTPHSPPRSAWFPDAESGYAPP